MQIEIVSVSPIVVEGKYPKMTLKFIRDGKAGERKLVAIGETKKVMEALKEAKEGEVYEIGMTKTEDGKFWNWESAMKLAPSVAATVAKSSYQTKSTYETPEERARKQVYIVRQSSLGTAVEYLTAQGKKFTETEVMIIAEKFCSFVFQTEGMATIDEGDLVETQKDLTDDIPF